MSQSVLHVGEGSTHQLRTVLQYSIAPSSKSMSTNGEFACGGWLSRNETYPIDEAIPA